MIPKLPETIDNDEMAELRALYERLPELRRIPFRVVLTTNYLILPLRRTLQAQKLGAKNFQLTPPPAPAASAGRAGSSSLSASAQRAAASSHR